MLIDSHAHLNFNAYKKDVDQVVKRCLDNNVWMVNVGSQYETSKRAVELAEKHAKGVYAAVGLHPIHLETGLVKIKDDPEEVQIKTREEEFDYEKYKELAKNEKVVAIGEIGLDYWYRPKSKAKLEDFKNRQKEVLLEQMKMAEELGLPVIFHCRVAHDDLISIIENSGVKVRGVVHCFTGDSKQARKYLEMGFYLGINGIIFKLALDDIIEKTPLDRILIETDCPYLTPPPKKGRNEPLFVKYVAERISQVKKIDYQEVEDITTKNARKLFRL